jgi:hypothetical protein
VNAVVALLARLEAGELGDPLPVLAYVAGTKLALPEAEVNEVRRRAMLLLAAGGDPRRQLEIDDRAVKSLAVDLYTDARRNELGSALDELALLARDLPTVREAVLFLAGDPDLAWRLFALGLVAEELGE